MRFRQRGYRAGGATPHALPASAAPIEIDDDDRIAELVAEDELPAELERRLRARLAATGATCPLGSLRNATACTAAVLITGDRRHFGSLFGRRIGPTLVLLPRDALAGVLRDDVAQAWSSRSPASRGPAAAQAGSRNLARGA